MYNHRDYKADFVCYGKIIVELKAVSEITDVHRSQVFNYLHATGFELGMLFNFGYSDGLERERIICTNYIIDHEFNELNE